MQQYKNGVQGICSRVCVILGQSSTVGSKECGQYQNIEIMSDLVLLGAQGKVGQELSREVRPTR